MSTDDALELEVERLTFGFDALAHHGGQVVFVPYAAAGDRVTAEVTERRRGYLRARVTRVERPGPARTVPGCRWFPACGGCQWQHVTPAAQRDAKTAVVAEQLARVGGIADPPVLPTRAAGDAWGYRSRITLVAEGRRIGYQRARSHTLVEVGECPIADPVVSAHLGAARLLAGGLRVPLHRLGVVAAPGGVVLVARATRRPGPADAAAAEAVLAREASVRGVVLAGGGARQVAGDPRVVLVPEPDLALEVPADVFTQVNAAANRVLVETVLAWSEAGSGTRVLDLYCGAGNFALPLARRGAAVRGIERDPLAAAAMRDNAVRLGLGGARVRCAAVESALREGVGDAIDVALLDPPRSGAAGALAALAALRPPRILYVSCDPATLARDVRGLGAHGYALARVQPVDLFPQTYHIESVAELRLT